MLVTLALLLHNLEDKKELPEEVKSQWSEQNASTHWPILLYNPFCQIQYYNKFLSVLPWKY